jgi:tetratricopeptide (TPR) repeat protein
VKVYSPEATLWLDWFEREHDNIRATLAWSQTMPEGLVLGPALIGSLLWFWYRRGYVHEGRRWSERVLDSRIAAGASAERALALHGTALLAMWQGDLHTAISLAEERLALVRQLEDELGIVTALMNLGTMLVNVGDDEAAEALLKEAQALCQNMGHDYFYAITIVHLGNASLGLGNMAEARDWLERALAISRTIGENWLLAFALNNLGEVARVQGDYARARAHYEESEALLREAGDKGDLARLIHSLGSVALHEAEQARAEALFGESLAMFRKLGNQRGIAECVAGFAGLRVAQGYAQWGALLLGAARAMLSATGAAWWPADRAEYERIRASIHSALPADAFAAAWAKGEMMTMEQALQSCMSVLEERSYGAF